MKKSDRVRQPRLGPGECSECDAHMCDLHELLLTMPDYPMGNPEKTRYTNGPTLRDVLSPIPMGVSVGTEVELDETPGVHPVHGAYVGIARPVEGAPRTFVVLATPEAEPPLSRRDRFEWLGVPMPPIETSSRMPPLAIEGALCPTDEYEHQRYHEFNGTTCPLEGTLDLKPVAKFRCDGGAADDLVHVVEPGETARFTCDECAETVEVKHVTCGACLAKRNVGLFVVVCYDSHTDDDITVHTTRESADAKIEKFKELYADPNPKRAPTWVERDYGQPKWCRFVETTHDDGPRARIEITEIV